MENIKIAVITPDRDYGRALGLALVDVYKNFTVTLYQSAPIHNELTGYDLILNDGTEGIGERIVGLVEKPSMTDQDYEQKRFLLYKYGNVRQLAAESRRKISCVLRGRRRDGMHLSGDSFCAGTDSFSWKESFIYQFGRNGVDIRVYGGVSGGKKYQRVPVLLVSGERTKTDSVY